MGQPKSWQSASRTHQPSPGTRRSCGAGGDQVKPAIVGAAAGTSVIVVRLPGRSVTLDLAAAEGVGEGAPARPPLLLSRPGRAPAGRPRPGRPRGPGQGRAGRPAPPLTPAAPAAADP